MRKKWCSVILSSESTPNESYLSNLERGPMSDSIRCGLRSPITSGVQFMMKVILFSRWNRSIRTLSRRAYLAVEIWSMIARPRYWVCQLDRDAMNSRVRDRYLCGNCISRHIWSAQPIDVHFLGAFLQQPVIPFAPFDKTLLSLRTMLTIPIFAGIDV